MANAKIKWHKVADSINSISWQPNNMAVAQVGGKTITLIKTPDDRLYACAHKCPHAGGIMADGFVDAVGNIVCPLHRYKFNTSNGRNVSGEGYYLKIFPLEERSAGIFVGFEEGGLFQIFG